MSLLLHCLHLQHLVDAWFAVSKEAPWVSIAKLPGMNSPMIPCFNSREPVSNTVGHHESNILHHDMFLAVLTILAQKKREYIIGYSPHVFITPNFWVKHTQTISKQSTSDPLVSWSHLRLLLHAAKGISSWSLDQGEGQISTGIGQTLVGSLVTGCFGTSN